MNQFFLGLELGMHLGRAVSLLIEELKKSNKNNARRSR